MVASNTSPPAGGHTPLSITFEQLETYRNDGFLIIKDALSRDTVYALLAETHQRLSDFSLDGHPMTKFSTGENDTSAHIGDDYFLTSGDKIRFFFEEDAFSKTGHLTKKKELAINKLGHYLHELSPDFHAATFSPLHKSVATSIGFNDPRVLQSMVICKQPEIGGAVPPHQDSTFLYTNPPSAVGFWIALEDATAANGTLSFARGSHKRSPVTSRFVRDERGGTAFEPVGGERFAADVGGLGGDVVNGKGYAFREDENFSEGSITGEGAVEAPNEIYELEEVKAGTLVLIHGNLLHKSEKNLSDKSRFIYTFHVIEGQLEYDERNWLQPPTGGFSRLYRA